MCIRDRPDPPPPRDGLYTLSSVIGADTELVIPENSAKESFVPFFFLDVFCASPKLGNCDEELVVVVVGGGPKPGKSGSFSSSSSSHDLAVEVLLPHADMILLKWC